MPLILGLLVFSGIVVMGTTLMGFVNPDRRLLRDNGPAASRSTLERVELNLDEFGLQDEVAAPLPWPSAAGVGNPRFTPLPWPSMGWDDEHFGKTLGPEQFAEMTAAREAKIHAKRNAEEKQHKKNVAKKPGRAPVQDEATRTRKKMAQRVQKEAQQLQDNLEDEFFEAKQRAQNAVQSNLGFDPAKVPAMVKEMGLAGAVEKIRRETGWDFKTAAQFVAKTLRG